MKWMSQWGALIAASALVFSPIMSFKGSADPVSSDANNLELAQAAADCRATNRTLDILSNPSILSDSSTVYILAPEERVTLAGSSSNGFVRVNSPANGYVIARYLKSCGGTPPPPPPPTGRLCRNVLAPGGLIIRSGATVTASVVGSVDQNARVSLTNPRNTRTESGGRRWEQIVAPRAGWVSSGLPEGNLSTPYNCP